MWKKNIRWYQNYPAWMYAISSMLILALSYRLSSSVFSVSDKGPWSRIAFDFLDVGLFLLSLYFYTAYILRCSFKAINAGGLRKAVRGCFAAAVVSAAVIVLNFFIAKEPYIHGKGAFLIGLAVMFDALRASLTEEMVFRGIIFETVQKNFGLSAAILTSSILSGIVYVNKGCSGKFLWIAVKIFAMISAGMALALITYQTRSIWTSVLIRTVASVIIVVAFGSTSDLGQSRQNESNASAVYESKMNNNVGENKTFNGVQPGNIPADKRESTPANNHAADSEKLEAILSAPEKYSAAMLQALENNSEILDFVAGYPEAAQKSMGGFNEDEKKQKCPLLLQWDKRWGYVPYGDDVLGLTGCGPTCLSMVIYSLTRDESATPDALAKKAESEGYYFSNQGTSWEFMSKAAIDYAVTAIQVVSMDRWEMESALDEGKLMICSMGPGDFTDSGHFIVVCGHSDNGFIIRDPFSRKRSEKEWDYDTLINQCVQMWVYG